MFNTMHDESIQCCAICFYWFSFFYLCFVKDVIIYMVIMIIMFSSFSINTIIVDTHIIYMCV